LLEELVFLKTILTFKRKKTNMFPDRTITPTIHHIDDINAPFVQETALSNGIEAYCINRGTQDVIRIDAIFLSGRLAEKQKGVAIATNRLLREGTNQHSSREIASAFDYLGAHLSVSAFYDYATVSLTCLNKHLVQLLPLFKEVLFTASFPEKELNIYVQNRKEEIAVEEQKVEFLARRLFQKSLYGENHPVGYMSSRDDLDKLNRDALNDFYNDFYTKSRVRFFASGKWSNDDWNYIDSTLGKNDWRTGSSSEIKMPLPQSAENKKQFIEKADAVQSAICIGKIMTAKNHPDYHGLKVLSTILGGYFGSRLMSTLREEKGFCYGIHAGLHATLYDSIFQISTEVGSAVTKDALAAIYNEIEILRNELIAENELSLVRNYLMGTLLGDTDGPFQSMSLAKSWLLYGMDKSFLEKYVKTILTIKPEEIRDLARKYFDTNSFYEAVAGNSFG
jgi:zinc protease